jgi:hypothetical protein
MIPVQNLFFLLISSQCTVVICRRYWSMFPYVPHYFHAISRSWSPQIRCKANLVGRHLMPSQFFRGACGQLQGILTQVISGVRQLRCMANKLGGYAWLRSSHSQTPRFERPSGTIWAEGANTPSASPSRYAARPPLNSSQKLISSLLSNKVHVKFIYFTILYISK